MQLSFSSLYFIVPLCPRKFRNQREKKEEKKTPDPPPSLVTPTAGCLSPNLYILAAFSYTCRKIEIEILGGVGGGGRRKSERGGRARKLRNIISNLDSWPLIISCFRPFTGPTGRTDEFGQINR